MLKKVHQFHSHAACDSLLSHMILSMSHHHTQHSTCSLWSKGFEFKQKWLALFCSCLFCCFLIFISSYVISRVSSFSYIFSIHRSIDMRSFRSIFISFINCPIKAKHMPNEANQAVSVLCAEAKKIPICNRKCQNY